MSKRGNLKRSWQTQNSAHFPCRFVFRINNHSKTELFLNVIKLVGICRLRHLCNSGAVGNTGGNGTAKQIKLVRIRYGNNQIRILNSCLTLNVKRSAVTDYTQNVKLICYIGNSFTSRINNGYVVIFL